MRISAPLMLAALLAALPAPARAASILDTITSGMSAERRDVMRAQVRIYAVPADAEIIDTIAEVLAKQLPASQAPEEIRGARESYAQRLRETGARTPAKPRGYTHSTTVDGDYRVFCFVGQENVSDEGEWDRHGSRIGRVPVHELGHAAFRLALSAEQHAELKRLWVAYASQKHPEADAYGANDEDEGFAELTEVWFGVHQLGLYKEGYDPSKPFNKLAPLIAFVEKIYGPSRGLY